MQLTHGHLLGGRVRYAQPETGFRSGIEPVLLAASVPVRTGERVLEAGSGAGAALLCLAARVPGVTGVGVERDPALTALAQQNAATNAAAGLSFLAATLQAADLPGVFDHAMANPPYHQADGTASPDAAREAAKRAGPGLLADWIGVMASALRRHGTLTLILPAAALPEALSALASAQCAASAVLPLWPKPGRPAKLLLVRGVRHGRSPLRLRPGLVLHRPDGRFTPETEAVLRDAVALDWGHRPSAA